MWNALRTAGLALSVMVTGACAAGASAGAGVNAGAEAGSAVEVTVENNLTVPAAVTVYLVPESGGRRLLGTVSPNRTETLRVSAGNVVGPARLMAQAPSGSELASPLITVSPGDQIVWDLRANLIRNR